MYNKATMAPMQIEALRFINKNPEDYNRHIYKIRVDELFKASYNLRVVRNSERLFLFIDGVQIAEFPIDLVILVLDYMRRILLLCIMECYIII